MASNIAKNKKTMYIIFGLLGILIALSAVFILNSSKILYAVGISKPAPQFMFNQSQAPGWWAAENYNSQAAEKKSKNYQGSEPIDKLPVASMNVFKGKKGDYTTACFVLFSYYDYKGDVAQLKQNKDRDALASTSMKQIGENDLSFNALGAAKNFIVAKYELIGPDAENAMKGMSYGWVDLGSDGYISVSGVCPTASELDETIQVMNAMSLVK